MHSRAKLTKGDIVLITDSKQHGIVVGTVPGKITIQYVTLDEVALKVKKLSMKASVSRGSLKKVNASRYSK